jgi:hypothetical protein
VLRRVDAYTAAGLADLVLHPCEHRYTPVTLAAAIEGAGLAFIGMELRGFHAQSSVLHAWRARWPEDPQMRDLANWESWETEHPTQFENMFTFWLQRPC